MRVLRQNGGGSHHGQRARIRRSGRPPGPSAHAHCQVAHGADVHAVGGEEDGRLRGHHEAVDWGDRPAMQEGPVFHSSLEMPKSTDDTNTNVCPALGSVIWDQLTQPRTHIFD